MSAGLKGVGGETGSPWIHGDRDVHLGEVRRAAEGLAALPLAGPPDLLAHAVLAALHALLAAVLAAQRAGCTRAHLRDAAQAARATYGRSHVIAHAQTWPLGHPGDHELVERLLDARAEGRPGTLAHALDATVLQLPIVWQHRAKVAWQAGLVRRALGGDGRARVLSIGCGGSRDLALLEAHELARLEVTLCDVEPRALALSRERLEGRVARLDLVPGNVLRVGRRVRDGGPFEAIVVGGLLDYLPDRAARLLIDQLLAVRAPDGLLGVTNIGEQNPWRPMLELICDWRLVERSEADLRRLLERPGLAIAAALDPTRLTWLVTAEAATR